MQNIQTMQSAMFCYMHASLLPPVGGVEARHDDEVVDPVADVEQAKHWREEL